MFPGAKEEAESIDFSALSSHSITTKLRLCSHMRLVRCAVVVDVIQFFLCYSTRVQIQRAQETSQGCICRKDDARVQKRGFGSYSVLYCCGRRWPGFWPTTEWPAGWARPCFWCPELGSVHGPIACCLACLPTVVTLTHASHRTCARSSQRKVMRYTFNSPGIC